jgi:ribonuclease T1
MPTRQAINRRDLALACSPGVGAASEAIVVDPAIASRYTARSAIAAAAGLDTACAVLIRQLLLLIAIALGTTACARDEPVHLGRSAAAAIGEVALDELPPQAKQTLALIRQGGPFPHRKDGTAFGNRERLLPQRPRGYYTEYTVPTPGSRDRGARRIVAGKGATGDPATSGEYYYTGDHYQSFRRIRP